MTDGSSDTLGFIEWAFGLILTGLGAMLSKIWMSHAALERKMEVQLGDARRAATLGDDKLWEELRGQGEKGSEFRERILSSMVTKEDLQAFENRVMRAMGQRRS